MADNEYLGLADEVFGGGEEVQPVAKPGAQAGLYGASVEPVRGESVELARELNLPVGTVERNFDELSKLAKRRRIDYSKLATDAPLTNDWLADPVNASVAGDDIDNLIGIEQAWDYLKKGASALGSGLPKFNEGIYGLGQAVTDTARTYVTGPLSKPIDLGLFDLQVLPEDPLAPVSDFFSELRQGQKGLAERMMPKGEGSVEQGVYSGLQSLGQNLLTLPAAIMSGNPGVALAPMVGGVGGSEYGRARDKGLDYSTAAIYATSQAAVEFATEKLPMGMLIKDLEKNTGFISMLGKQLAAELPGEQIATLLQDLNEWAVLNPEKPFSAYLAERPNAALQTAIATAIGTGGMVTTAKGIEAVARRFDSRAAKAAKASETRKALDQLNNLVNQAKVKQTSPSTMQAFADHVAQGGSLYVDARQLANALQQSGIDLNQVAADIPSIGEQLQAKAAAGQHIKIPAGEFLTKVAGSNYAQVMLDHLKTDPNEWSQAEADEVLKGNTEAAKAEVERIIRVKRDIDAHEASAEVVRKGFEDQLNTANRFSKDVNKAYAQMLGSFYSVIAARIGMTPEEMAAKYPLLISAEQTGGEQVGGEPASIKTLDDRLDAFIDERYRLRKEAGFTRGTQETPLTTALRAVSKASIDEDEVIAAVEWALSNGRTDIAQAAAERAERAAASATEQKPGVSQDSPKYQLIVEDLAEIARAKADFAAKLRQMVGPAENKLNQFAGVRAATADTYAKEQSAQLPDTIEVDGVQRPTVNSNGKPIAQTEEGIRNFWRWFGDSKVVDEQGRPLVVYHGTGGDFDAFQLNAAGLAWAAQDAEYANSYTTDGAGNVLPVYFSVNSPFDFGFRDTHTLVDFAEIAGRVKKGVTHAFESEAVTREQGKALVDEVRALERRDDLKGTRRAFEWRNQVPEIVSILTRAGYDGIVAKEGRDAAFKTFAVFSPEQIKSAVGNSGAFDPQNPNILYQGGEQQNDRLAAVHNLSAENLAFADQMGGIAVPSIGVVRDQAGGVDGFGEITMIGTKDMADPKQEPVFSSDAYTVRFPKPEYGKAKSKDAMKLVDEIRDFAKRFDDRSIVDITYDSAVNYPNPEEIVRKWRTSSASRALFLEQKGERVEPVMYKPAPVVSWFDTKALRDFAAEHGVDRSFGVRDNYHLALSKAALNAVNEYFDSRIKERGGAAADRLNAMRENTIEREFKDGVLFFSRAVEAVNHLDNGDVDEVDTGATREMIDQKLEGKESEFDAWLNGKIMPMFGDPSLKVGSKKEPYTLDNIVKYMTSNKVKGEEKTSTFGAGQARAAASIKFKDLEQMRAIAKDEIVDPADYKAAKDRTDKLLEDYRSKVAEFTEILNYRGQPDIWEANDAAMRAIAKFSTSKARDAAALRKALKAEDFRVSDIHDDVIDLGIEAANALLRAPVPYFEAKPQRAVKLSEFAGAVIPSDASEQTRQILEKNGIPFVEYSRDDEKGRANAVRDFRAQLAKSRKDVLFQAAYHGSPFKFDKFTLDHIGNGEGAQAYGWGLYFAGSKDVAEWYRDNLAGKNNGKNLEITGESTPKQREAAKHFADYFADSDFDSFDEVTQDVLDAWADDIAAETGDQYLSDALRNLDTKKLKAPTGQLYKVDIPDAGYLLWDKPLSQQPDDIKEAIKGVEYFIESVLGKDSYLPADTGAGLYGQLTQAMGAENIDDLESARYTKEASKFLNDLGITGIKYLDGTSRADGEGSYNYVVFDDQAIQVLDTFYQDEQSNQRPLAEISFANDITSTPTVITLLKGANLSSFIHESGHFFLEVLADISSRPNAPLLLQDDFKTVMDWFGVTREQWASMTLEQKRPYHEQFARGFEVYAWEGKAPSLALSKLFQRFRAWMLDAYKKLLDAFNNRDLGKALDVRLSDDVRAVFDRMLATQEQINEANLARGYMPAFETKEEAEAAGVDWEQYQADLEQANQDAITDLESRSLRDLRWFRNAHNKEVRRLRREAAALRREARIDARAEVMSHPIYQAMQFLTAPVDAIKAPKAKSDPNVVDPANDSLLVAVAKLGGLQRDMAVDQFGLDPADFKKTPVFGKPILRRNGGMTPDGMAEALAQLGYMPAKFGGSWDMNDLGDYLHDEGKGIPHYSETFDYRNLDEQTAGLPDLEANPFVGGRIDRESMVREYGGSTEEFPWENLGKMISNDGIHPDVIADRFGFQSGDEMVRFLMEAKPLQAAIEDTTDRIMFERHGDLTSKEALDKAADEAIHNKMRAKVLATEANALAKTLGARGITAKAARVFAERILAGMKILDIKPSHFAAEESKAAARFDRARKKGNVNDQALEKRNQLVNNIATRLAYDAEEEVAKAVRHFKQLQKPGSQKSMRGEYLEQLNALLERFELRTGGNSRKAINKANTLPAFAEWLQTKAEELGAPTPDMVAFVLDGGIKKPYRDMTLEEFRGLVDAVKQLEHLARREQKQYMEIRGMEFEQEKNAILDRLRQFHPDAFDADGKPKPLKEQDVPTVRQKLIDNSRGMMGELLGIETILNVLEGGNLGLLHESLFKRISDRSNWRTTRMEGIFKKLEPLFDQYTILEKRAFSSKDIGGPIGMSTTREKALGVALLAGNAEGRDRLRNYGWSDEQIIKIIDLLDERDKKLAEGIWDIFDNDLWPELKSLNERTAGKAPPKVEATPFTNRLGTWKGGYYKLTYDKRLDERAYKFDADKSLADLRNGLGLSGKTAQGSSKERQDNVKLKPRRDFNVFVEAVNETVHDIAYREAISDVIRLLNNEDIRDALKAIAGPEVFWALRTRVAEIASPPRNPMGPLEKFVSIARRNVVVTLMSGVGTAFQNLTGIIPAAGRVHPWLLSREVQRFYWFGWKKSFEFATSQSDYMKHRFTTYEQDLINTARKLTVNGSMMPDTGTWLALMGWIDRGVAVPVWNAAFAEGLEKYGNDKKMAVEYADHVVRQTQGSGRMVDKPGIMTGNPLKTAFTMFHSYFNSQLQQLVRAGLVSAQEAKTNPRAAAGRVALAFVVFWILPALVTEMFRRTPDDEDDEEKLKRYIKGLALYPTAMFPIVRDIAPIAWDKAFSESGWSRSYKMSPIESGVEGVIKGIESSADIVQGEGDQQDVKNLLMGIGFAAGIPGKLISDVITGTYDFATGEAGPQAMIMGPEPKK